MNADMIWPPMRSFHALHVHMQRGNVKLNQGNLAYEQGI